MRVSKNKKIWASAGALFLGAAALAGFFYYKGRFKAVGFVDRTPQAMSAKNVYMGMNKILRRRIADTAERLQKGKEKDVRGQILQEMDLQGAKIDGTDFTEANMRGANIKFSSFTDSFFENTDLRRITAQATQWERCSLNGADFRWAKLQGARIGGEGRMILMDEKTDFRGAKLQGVTFNVLREHLQKAKWRGAVYDEATKFPQGFNPQSHGMRMITKRRH